MPNSSRPPLIRSSEAKRRAIELVHAMKDGDRMTILTFAGATTTLVPLTEDVNALLAAIDTFSSAVAPTNLEQALIVAGSVAGSLSGAKIYVLGDGCYPESLELPDEVKQAILARIPQQRMGTADEVADVIGYLLSLRGLP